MACLAETMHVFIRFGNPQQRVIRCDCRHSNTVMWHFSEAAEVQFLNVFKNGEGKMKKQFLDYILMNLTVANRMPTTIGSKGCFCDLKKK